VKRFTGGVEPPFAAGGCRKTEVRAVAAGNQVQLTARSYRGQIVSWSHHYGGHIASMIDLDQGKISCLGQFVEEPI